MKNLPKLNLSTINKTGMNVINLVRITSLLTVFFLINSCVEYHTIEKIDLSKIIIGKWVQTRSFDITNASTNPPSFDWFNVENGFTLELARDGSFVYTRYGTCMTGTYLFDSELQRINFFFDCEVEFDGKIVTEITEFLDDTVSNSSTLFIEHAVESSKEKNFFSYLRRIG